MEPEASVPDERSEREARGREQPTRWVTRPDSAPPTAGPRVGSERSEERAPAIPKGAPAVGRGPLWVGRGAGTGGGALVDATAG